MSPTNIYLIGLPGSGKTTLGKPFAETLQYDFLDLDEKIEQDAGMSIPEIFEKHGEDHFRKLEQKAVQESLALSKTVIATGGGAPCFFDNMTQMNQHGTSIFLDVSVEELFNRLHGKGTDNRPLLQGKSVEELKEEIALKREQRLSFYEQSEITIQSDQITYEDLLLYAQV